jgi:hypothetical protein
MLIYYLKSSQTYFEGIFSDEYLEFDYFNSEYKWSDTHIWSFINNDNRVKFKEVFLDNMHKYDSETNIIKCHDSINEVLFKCDGKIVQKIKWIPKDIGCPNCYWDEKTISSWDNCVDPEYIEFLAWYKYSNC